MREILFRGKRIGDGKWFEGYYCGGTEDKTISPCIFEYLGGMKGYDYHNIILDTLGQYTGLYDKNGVRIWENDIVIIGGNKSFPTMIEFLSGSWQCVRKYTDKGRENEYNYLHQLEYDNPNQYEIIGNRFDNLDLLK